VDGFDMPVKVLINGQESWIQPSTKLQKKRFNETIEEILIDRNFYVE